MSAERQYAVTEPMVAANVYYCATARAVENATRAGSVDTHTDTPGEDTHG